MVKSPEPRAAFQRRWPVAAPTSPPGGHSPGDPEAAPPAEMERSPTFCSVDFKCTNIYIVITVFIYLIFINHCSVYIYIWLIVINSG